MPGTLIFKLRAGCLQVVDRFVEKPVGPGRLMAGLSVQLRAETLPTIRDNVSPRPCPQVVGRLAEKPAGAGRQVAGLLVRARGRDALLAAGDLPAYTKLHPGRVLQRQALPLTCPFSQVCRPLPSLPCQCGHHFHDDAERNKALQSGRCEKWQACFRTPGCTPPAACCSGRRRQSPASPQR